MNVEIIPNIFDPTTFNKVAPHPLQSWQWGEARKKMGIDILRVGEFTGDILGNVFQLTFHKIPHTPFTIGYLPRSVIPSKEVIDCIVEEARKRKAVFVKIEPYITRQKGELVSLLSVRESSHPLFPSWTQVLDLTKSEEDLMVGMKSKTRYNIRVAQKHGVIVRELTNDEGFEMFAKLYFATTQRQEYRGHDKAYHQTIFETLKGDTAHILIAFYQGKPLAAYELFLFNDVLYYPYGGSSLEYKEMMASNLLMWEAIRFGKAHGAKVFDMWGSLPPDYDQETPWAGFTRFKEGFGGEFVEFVGSYDLVLNNALYSLYNLADKVRRTVL